MTTPHIPHGLSVIADAAGIEAALTIALAKGGTRLRIPQKAEGSILEKVVGIDAAMAIVECLADERIEIPHAKRHVAMWLRKQDWSQERVANRLKVSRRSIQNWESDKTPTLQIDLFPKAV